MTKKNGFGLALGIATLALVALPTANVGAQQSALSEENIDRQIHRGFEISPIAPSKLNLKGKSAALVGLGSYILNTSGCNDCHTWPNYTDGHDPFQGQMEQINVAGFMAGGRPFLPSPFISANLTPDFMGRPAHLTMNEFIATLKTGHNPHDPAGQLLQIMPWPVYGKKTDADLAAIYTYLSALPCIEGEPDDPSAPPRCK